MDAVELLLEDHKRVKEMFREFESAGERAHKKKEQLARTILTEIETHSRLEEEVFYPAYKEAAKKDGQKVLAESYEEHAIVDRLVEELKLLTPADETFEAKMTVLIENVEHHIEEEEAEMLPDAKKVLGKQLERLGEEMALAKEQIMATLVPA